MELTQLIQFKAIAENNSISIASKKLHISQPALSTSLKKLETELEIQLFDHTKNKIILNEAGKIALKHANLILNQSEVMKEELINYKQKYLKTKIGFCDPGPMWYCAPFFSSIINEIQYESYLSNTDEIKVLLDEKYDLTISSKPLNHLEIESIPFVEERMYLSVDKSHPLAKESSISLQDARIKEITRFYIPGYYFTKKQKPYWKQLQKTIIFTIYTDYFIFCQALNDPNVITTTTRLVRHYRHDGNNRVLIPIIDNQMKIMYYISYLKINKNKLTPFIDLIKNSVVNI